MFRRRNNYRKPPHFDPLYFERTRRVPVCWGEAERRCDALRRGWGVVQLRRNNETNHHPEDWIRGESQMNKEANGGGVGSAHQRRRREASDGATDAWGRRGYMATVKNAARQRRNNPSGERGARGSATVGARGRWSGGDTGAYPIGGARREGVVTGGQGRRAPWKRRCDTTHKKMMAAEGWWLVVK